MPVVAQAPAQLLFYRLSEPVPVARAHWLQGRWTPMHYNCSSQVLKQPKSRLKGEKWAILFCDRFSYSHNLLASLSKCFTLQCFSASLKSFFFMASLALFSSVLTSLLDIWAKPWDPEKRLCLVKVFWLNVRHDTGTQESSHHRR